MSKSVKLLEGSISRGLLKLSLPLMASSLIGIAYTITDAMWLGRLSTQAVSSVGTTHFYVWMLQALALIASVGIKRGSFPGLWQQKPRRGKTGYEGWPDRLSGPKPPGCPGPLFGQRPHYFHLSTFSQGPPGCRDLFKNHQPGDCLYLYAPFLTASFYAQGDSLTPFKISILALVFNIVFDPVLIFGWGPFPRLEVAGAAIAFVLAQVLATSLLLYASYIRKGVIFQMRKPPPWTSTMSRTFSAWGFRPVSTP